MGSARVVATGTVRRLAAIAILTVLLASCTQSAGTAKGLVSAVDGSLAEVTAFSVLSGGAELEFLTLPDQQYEFPLQHMREHLRTGEPVVVEWELRDDLRYALSINDG